MWCKSRRVPAIIVGIFSAIVFMLGVAMIVLSLEFNFSFENLKNLDQYRTAIFVFLITGSILAVLTAILAAIIACR
jgi:hypothetical protein